MAMYPMLQTLPDVVVHFAQSDLNGAHNLGMIKRAGIKSRCTFRNSCGIFLEYNGRNLC
jgi:hypothetical protein